MTSIIFIIFFLLNFILYIYNQKIASLLELYDKPDNFRKVHKSNVPLTGGIIIIINIFFLLTFLFLQNNFFLNINIFYSKKDFLIFIISSISIFLIGYFDDKFKISAVKKFFLMILLFTVIIIYGKGLLIQEIKVSFLETSYFLPNYISIIWTLLCFLLFVNALNMFDGINYQVSIYSIFISFFFVINNYFPIFFLILGMSLLFFLILNHNNKSFLGDSGSYLLGFVFSYFFIKFYNSTNLINTDQIVLFMIIPGIDLMRLFIYRIYKGNYPFTPDRNHLHHIMRLKNSLIITNIKVLLLTIVPATLGFYFGYTYLFLAMQIIIYFYFISKK